MVEKRNVTIPELTGDAERLVYTYLPESYRYDTVKRYPVLYMFDGHNIFFDSDATYGKCWGMKEYMDYTQTQLIIVAVECNHSPDNGRLREYSPFDFTDRKLGTFKGLGRLTMDWIVGSLKPDIDSRYRTLADRGHTFIGGSSMGGLMSLYAVMEYNHIFSRAAALSPSIWTNREKIDQMIKQAHLEPDTVVYMDYGSNEISFHPTMRRQFRKTAKLLLKRRVYLTCRIVPDGDHCEACWEQQLPFFMNTLMYHI